MVVSMVSGSASLGLSASNLKAFEKQSFFRVCAVKGLLRLDLNPQICISSKESFVRRVISKRVVRARAGFIDDLRTDFPRRKAIALILSIPIFSSFDIDNIALAQQPVVFREYIDTFDGYSFKYPKNWIQVRGAGADIFFRDPFVLDENLSLEVSSPSSSNYKSIEDLGSPQQAGEKVLKQYLTEFMSTRLGVRRESNILSTSSRVADDGKMYYEVEVNIKSYANNNELAVMPQDRVARLEWNRRYLSVLGVENKQLYELRLQTPENVFAQEENELRRVMDSFRVNKVAV